MIKRAAIFIFLIISFSSLFAQIPSWKVNEPDYQFTMTIVSKLNMDGTQLLVGVLVNSLMLQVQKHIMPT